MNCLKKPAWLNPFAAAGVAVLLCVGSAQAVVLIDDDFTAAEGYVDGKLQFQQPDGAGNGIWLGQFNNPDNGGTGNPSVDSTGTGTVNVISEGPPNGDAFLRNVWNLGATGGTAGGAADGTTEIGNGFSEGDQIKIDIAFRFTLPDGTGNHPLFISGVTDCFVNCGFNASPRAGLNLGVSEFQAGTIKVFTHNGRQFFNGADNPFATFVPLPEVGIANGWNPETEVKDLPTDLESDLISISYTAELTDEATKTWTAQEVIVTNVDTETTIATASIDFAGALESFVWDSEANAPNTDPTTPTEQGVAAHPTSPGSEMYFGTRWLDNVTPGGSASFDSVRFEYIPVPGDPVPGDYNGNGVVDAADYTVWRDSLGQIGGGLPADGTGDDDLGVPDGDVDEFDYAFWKNRFGNVSGSGSAIPEPTSALLAVLALIGCAGSRRRV